MIDILRVASAGLNTPAMRAVRAAVAADLAANALAGAAPVQFPPPAREDRTPELVAAILAAGMIAATGREHTAEEAGAVFRGVQATLASSDGNSLP